MPDLIHRLRCQYPNGPVTDGTPEFGWRDLSGPAPEGMTLPSPVMLEAAEEIERLRSALIGLVGESKPDGLRAMLRLLRAVPQPNDEASAAIAAICALLPKP